MRFMPPEGICIFTKFADVANACDYLINIILKRKFQLFLMRIEVNAR